MNNTITFNNGSVGTIDAQIKTEGNKVIATIKKEDIPKDAKYIDFMCDYLVSGIDENGYYFAPRGTKENGTILTYFKEREDCEYISDSNSMSIFGFKTSEKSVFAVVTGMTFEYRIVCGVKDNKYYIYPKFFLNEKNHYEDIVVEYYNLPVGTDYNDMAMMYRKIKNPKLLKERVKNNEQLEYALKSPEIRVRLAWKPVPARVMHQTLENEPEVVLGCTLDRVKDIIDGLEKRGVKEAEICLVGVETKGHDGRWPQLLPIEESIGGEAKLRELCEYGQDKGYQMVVHTNSTEMYEISSDWDVNQLVVKEDGEYSCDEIAWGGGQPFHICPKCTVKYNRRNTKDIYDMGFKGMHYIDVFSNFPPRNCYSEAHPSTARESAAIICDLAKETQEMFGGFASEGPFDFISDYIDYVLYTSYNLYGEQHPIVDETIPFWQLVFHGSILYNPSTETVNYCVKEEKSHLKYIEYGGRPLAYFNSKYVDETPDSCGNWMGNEDLLLNTDEILDDSLDKIKAMYDEYNKLNYLQYETMDKHEKVCDNVYRVTYSDGTKITVDYNKNTYEVVK